MDVKQITTRDILETLGIVPENGLPQRGEYKCYLEYGGYDVRNFNDDLTFTFNLLIDLIKDILNRIKIS